MIPKELTALVRSATAAVKAHRALREARADEASAAALVKREKALTDALDALDKTLGHVAVLAARPNEPIDLGRLMANLFQGLETVKTAADQAKEFGRTGKAPRPIIDVKPGE